MTESRNSSMKIAELRAALSARGLLTKGKKKELMDRLAEDDANAKAVISSELEAQKREEIAERESVFSHPSSRRSSETEADPGELVTDRGKLRGSLEREYLQYTTTLAIFSVTYGLLIVLSPIIFKQPLPFKRLLHISDAIDVLTPVIILSFYWYIIRKLGDGTLLSNRAVLVFVQIAGLWGCGHGMHLAANSIYRHSPPTGNAHDITYFYDEILGHFVWSGATVLLSVLACFLQSIHPFNEEALGSKASSILVFFGGALHGFELFLVNVEGQTPYYIPLLAGAIIAIVFIYVVKRGVGFRNVPMVMFMVSASISAVILTAIWAYMNGGELPEFSAVGWI